MSDIICSGALFYAKSTKRFLFLLRNNGKTAGTWGIVGGKKEDGDVTTFEALKREVVEEIGHMPDIVKVIPLELFVSKDNKFYYHTYLLVVEDEFLPKLNEEHSGWAWCEIDRYPRPLHQALRSSFDNSAVRNKLETVFEVVDLV